MGWKEACMRPLIHKYQRQYQKQVEEKQESFSEFIAWQEKQELQARSELTDAERQEIDKISDDILFLRWTDGRVEEHATDVFARYFQKYPEAVVAYCDEAPELMYAGLTKDLQGKELLPSLKPDWSPDLFLSRFYFSGLVAVRRSVLLELKAELGEITPDAYLSKDEIWELFYRIIKIKDGFNNRKTQETPVIHIPQILFWRAASENSETDFITGGKNPVGSLQDKEKGDKTEEDIPDVSIIIPSKDHSDLLETCIRSVCRTVEHLKLEILVVDNGSCEENRQILQKLAEEFSFTYFYHPMPFHFAKMCNLGASHAKGKQLLFLNDDIECIHAGWLEAMQEVASRPHVGAVGSKLLYPDGERIQHAGIVNLPIGPVHKLQFLPDSEIYYDGFNRGQRNVLAVTGACLLLRRELYEECGGMSEELAVAFNDVELCFRLYEKGYYQVVLQDKPLLHHESVSRGDDESPEKWKRLMQERATLYRLHPALEGKDPFYSTHLNRNGLDTQILPGYLQGKQKRESVTPLLWKEGIPKGAREDNCLLLRAEICREAVSETDKIEFLGYGVVLGSDNSRFGKELLLRKGDVFYRIPYEGQIREDLARNMPDQQNIALSGFWVTFEKNTLPEGIYELGMYAWDRLSRTKLYCFSGRTIEFE